MYNTKSGNPLLHSSRFVHPSRTLLSCFLCLETLLLKENITFGFMLGFVLFRFSNGFNRMYRSQQTLNSNQPINLKHRPNHNTNPRFVRHHFGQIIAAIVEISKIFMHFWFYSQHSNANCLNCRRTFRETPIYYS